MKILHKFIKEGKTWEYPAVVKCEYHMIRFELPHTVMFRGQAWEWQTYDKVTGKDHEAELLYTPLVSSWYTPIHTIGPTKAVVIKCDCGAEKVGHPGHSHWCDKLNKNGWDEAIRQELEFDRWKQIVDADNKISDDNAIDLWSQILKGIP